MISGVLKSHAQAVLMPSGTVDHAEPKGAKHQEAAQVTSLCKQCRLQVVWTTRLPYLSSAICNVLEKACPGFLLHHNDVCTVPHKRVSRSWMVLNKLGLTQEDIVIMVDPVIRMQV